MVKVIVLMIALSLSFMAMYVVKFLVGSTSESFKPIMLDYPKYICFVDPTAETLGISRNNYQSFEDYNKAFEEKRTEVIEKLKQQKGVDDVYYTQLLDARYNGIVGAIGYDFPLISPDKIPGYLKHMNATLIDGKMPAKDGEIIVDQVIMKNNHFAIGDYFYDDSYGKTFTIVGTLKSDMMICVGTPNGYTNSGWGITILCNENNCEAKKLFETIGKPLSDNDTIIDKAVYQSFYDKEVQDAIDSALSAIVAVIITFLSVSIVVAYVSFLRNRVEEYCLYMSIGYSRKDIYGMIMREIMIIFGISILIGGIVSLFVMKVMAWTMLEPVGIVYCYWYPEHIITILAAYVAIVGILQIPIVYAINSIKTIDRIEE
jgi:ABC-type antimicrobial peptide transport system permease subunit